MIEVQLTEPLPINATLFDGNISKFLRAKVYDKTFIEVAGSPFVLNHVSNGTYRNSAFIPTIEGIYIAIVEVYEENTFTTLSIDYTKGEETFLVSDRESKLDTIVSDIDATRTSINENIDGNEGEAV